VGAPVIAAVLCVVDTLAEVRGDTTVQVLRRAKALLKKKGWTRGAMARDVEGNPVIARSKKAAKFCAVGAIHAVAAAGERQRVKALDALDSAAGPHDHAVSYNDARRRTLAQVLTLFDKAIVAAKAGEKSR
jgi:hypothetical protein